MKFSDIEDIHVTRQTKSFSHKFFEQLSSIDQEFDNHVLDVSFPYSTSSGRVYISDLFQDNENVDTAFSYLGEEFFSKVTRDGRKLLQVKSSPFSRMAMIDNLDSSLYLPDITEDCLTKSTEEMNDVTGILEYLDERTDELEVKKEMDIQEYSEQNLHETDIVDDEAIVQAAKKLNGDTIILTYDSDFLSYDIPATTPEIAERV